MKGIELQEAAGNGNIEGWIDEERSLRG